MFELDNVKNEAILQDFDNIQIEAIMRDFFNFWTWQHPKGSNSARLLQFSNLTTSKTKQFCETSFKNESWVQSWRPRTNAFCDFPVHLSKVLRLPRKSDARSYEVLHLSRKIILAYRKIWCSKMQPLAGNHPPHLLTPMKMSLVLRLPRKMHLCRSSSHAQRLPSFLEMPQNPHVFSLVTFDKVHNPLRLPRKRHLNLQKWRVHVVLCAFWLRNVLRATFSTSQLPKVARTCGVSMCF